jgi:iron complex outermembrane receptor protein
VYGAVDLGGMSDDKRFGYRINAATETINSYVDGADGNRNFVSGAFDWHLSNRALLQLDMDYQHKSQVTAPGYQLLNNTNLPSDVNPNRLLGKESWNVPVTDNVSNIGLRFNYDFGNNWHATIGANRYLLKRDDHSAFPSGCAAQGLSVGFCGNGDYDVYDYRSDNERHEVIGTQALLQGKVSASAILHDLTFGFETMRRRDTFGDYAFDPVGTSNIYNPRSIPTGGSSQSTEPNLRRKDDEQSLFAQDIMSLNDQLKLHIGARYTELKRQQFDNNGIELSQYDRSYVLPNVAIVYSPRADISVYGSYAQGLQHGGVAPLGTDNENQMLNPERSTQVEFGMKTDVSRDLSFTAAVFQIKAPLEYTDYNLSTNGTFLQNGDAIHRGIELGLQGRVTRNLLLGSSLTALNAKQENTGDPTLDGKRNVNVPKLKAVTFLDYALEDVPGLNLNTTWTYASSKAFDTQNQTIVGGYNVFDLGARYATKIKGKAVRFNFTVYNVFNKFYWRDVTQDLGGYLFPGAPRTYKLTAQFDF